MKEKIVKFISDNLINLDDEIEIKDDEGVAEWLTANPNKNMKIRVKAQNYLPYVGELEVNQTGIISNQKSNCIEALCVSWKGC